MVNSEISIEPRSNRKMRMTMPNAVTFRLANQDEADDLKRDFGFARAGSLPKWFDIPFDKPLLLLEESGEHTDRQPSFANKWYVDEELAIVYFQTRRG